MKMNKKPLILLVFILLLLPVVVTAQVGASDDEKLSEQEKTELIAFTKRFMSRMQKTRDITSLMKEFLLPPADVSAFLISYGGDDGEYKPNASEAKRLVIVTSNYFYLDSLAGIVGGYDYRLNLRSILPERLARRLEEDYESLLDAMDKNDGRRFRSLLPRVEQYQKRAREHLKRKNYERTAKYGNVIAEREKEEFYKYEINLVLQCEDDEKDSPGCLLQRFGPDTRAYSVGMPHGLGPIVVKLKSGYKILFIFPHPMSG